MPFDKKKDKIAITIPKFTMLKKSEGPLDRYSEPYIVSVAIDSNGIATPKLDFNIMQFPKVAKGATVTMLGDGHLLYGPKNPGDYVALSILIMERDQDVRNLGKVVENAVKSKAADLGMKVLMASDPGAVAVLGILKELTQLISGLMQNNKDDELYRIDGTFLRDHAVPYHINRSYNDLGNDFVKISLKIIPLSTSNKEGVAPKAIAL